MAIVLRGLGRQAPNHGAVVLFGLGRDFISVPRSVDIDIEADRTATAEAVGSIASIEDQTRKAVAAFVGRQAALDAHSRVSTALATPTKSSTSMLSRVAAASSGALSRAASATASAIKRKNKAEAEKSGRSAAAEGTDRTSETDNDS